MYYCGLDPSLNSYGVCIINDRGTVVHVECIVPQNAHTSDSRLHYIYNRLIAILEPFHKDIKVLYEKQIPQMRWAANAGGILSLAENIGITKLALSKLSIESTGVTPGDIKKFATNNAKATKEDMIAALPSRAKEHITYNIPEHSINDVADAYHMARLCRETFHSLQENVGSDILC